MSIMVNPFKQAGDLMKMKGQMDAMQKELEKIEVEVEKHNVKVVVNGAMKIITLESNGQSDKDIKDAVNEAYKNAQETMAKKMRDMGGLDALMGMMGGK